MGRVPYLVPPALPSGTLSGRLQPVLTGSAVRVRPWAVQDAPELVTAYADPDIQRWHCRSLDLVEAVALIEEWNEAWVDEISASWAVTDGERVLGRVGFRVVDLSAGVAEVGYWVLPSARGRGVARDALATLTRWSFDDLGLQRLELTHSTENQASCRVAAAVDYPLEGTARASVLHTDGWHDMHRHARVRTD